MFLYVTLCSYVLRVNVYICVCLEEENSDLKTLKDLETIIECQNDYDVKTTTERRNQ